MKTIHLKFILMLTMLSTSLLINADEKDKDKDKDTLKFKVIENTSTSLCAYQGNVSISTKYKTKDFNSELGNITVESTSDGIVYSTVYSQKIEQGRGKLTMTFDVGECSKDLRVKLTDQ